MKISYCPVCQFYLALPEFDKSLLLEDSIRHGFDAAFCVDCGAKLEKIRYSEGTECSKCGSGIERHHKFCSKCREENKDYKPRIRKYCTGCQEYASGNFCEDCGSGLEEITEEKKCCTQCRRRIYYHQSYCPNCGEPNSD